MPATAHHLRPVVLVASDVVLGGIAAAAGIAVINSVGNLAGFVSPYMIGSIIEATSSADVAMFVLAGVLVIGSLAVLTTDKSTVNR